MAAINATVTSFTRVNGVALASLYRKRSARSPFWNPHSRFVEAVL